MPQSMTRCSWAGLNIVQLRISIPPRARSKKGTSRQDVAQATRASFAPQYPMKGVERGRASTGENGDVMDPGLALHTQLPVHRSMLGAWLALPQLELRWKFQVEWGVCKIRQGCHASRIGLLRNEGARQRIARAYEACEAGDGSEREGC